MVRRRRLRLYLVNCDAPSIPKSSPGFAWLIAPRCWSRRHWATTDCSGFLWCQRNTFGFADCLKYVWMLHKATTWDFWHFLTGLSTADLWISDISGLLKHLQLVVCFSSMFGGREWDRSQSGFTEAASQALAALVFSSMDHFKPWSGSYWFLPRLFWNPYWNPVKSIGFVLNRLK